MSKKLTTEEFIEKAKTVHCDKYVYSKVEYINTQTKVCITCPEHGDFWQTPSSHLQGQGCPECGNIKRGETFKITNNEFIGRAIKKHGDKYEYDKTEYIDSVTPVTIKCKKHGYFEMIPHRFIQGNGCPECAHEKRYVSVNRNKTTDDFILELKDKFGDDIDYGEIVYVNAKTPVWITDKKLNKRYQITPTHLLTRGLKKEFKSTQDDFIEKAKKIHRNKYTYLKVEYINNTTPVCIICPEHGDFWQKPTNHLKGYGCPKCGCKSGSDKLKLTKNVFINKANEIHGNFYNYDDFIYVNFHTKSNITCPIHGDFEQTPAKHLEGHGCPKCNESNLERDVRLFLEKNNIPYIQEFTDDWLKNGKGKQRFDFLIKNTNYLIECQGIQHFVNANFKYKGNVNKIIERDERKYNLALKHGYKVFYYTAKDNAKYKNISHIYQTIYTNLYDMLNDMRLLTGKLFG